MEADQQRETTRSGDESGRDFSAYINGDAPVLVHFYADRCSPCNSMSRILEEVKPRAGAAVKIIQVNITNNPQVIKAFHIKHIPALLLFRNGKIHWRWSGVVLADELLRVLRSVTPDQRPPASGSHFLHEANSQDAAVLQHQR